MGLFSSEPKECGDGEYHRVHEGPFQQLDEQWEGDFRPTKHDDEYVYGYVETNPYARCEHCDSRVKYTNVLIERELKKVKKDEIPEIDLDKIEVSLDRLMVK
ncbi:hypothetical protein M199_gp253 [Halogranum tailed virus 1]|uniref:Uncharacterized protein n=1 Tax=Halogranum tailed virus 1 TaxID=1273749 RepID=R4TMM7_9CAUD|nr:hypothetical protein M199_gp253 [Halogranum tailed virus 1]AGM11413.1 hypothetical protein HGTV1_115 [Halogranum tailed virus 1]